MVFVKYLKSIHLEALLSRGSIRIGSSSFYKNPSSGKMVSDASEGQVTVSGEATNVTQEALEEMPLLKGLVHTGPGSNIGRVRLESCRFVVPDFFLFSAADKYDLETHLKWHKNQGYDAAYMIRDPNSFFKLITAALAEKAGIKYFGYGFAEYYDQQTGLDIKDPRTFLPPFFFKDALNYSEQSEIRFIWTGHTPNPDVHYIDLEIEGLGQFIDPINTL